MGDKAVRKVFAYQKEIEGEERGHCELRFREEDHARARAPLSFSCIAPSLTTHSMPTRMSPPVTLAKNEHSRHAIPVRSSIVQTLPGYSVAVGSMSRISKAEESGRARSRDHRTTLLFFFSLSLSLSLTKFSFFASTETTWVLQHGQMRP